MLRLLVTHGHTEQVFLLPEGEARLGSSPDNDIVLRVEGVSRRHAVVRRRPEGIEVVDLGSKNKLFIGQGQVTSALLTPGLRVQIGRAWVEVEELSSSEKALAELDPSFAEEIVSLPPRTPAVGPAKDPRDHSPAEAGLALAFHIAQRGVGIPGRRQDLLLQIQAILGAASLASFDRRLRGKLRPWESAGDFLPEERKLFDSLAAGMRGPRVILTRSGHLLLAGRDSWFLGAKFADEATAQTRWRRDLLRFLAEQFFKPVQSLDELAAAEARRVLALARGNKTKAAKLLDRARGTLDSLLTRKSSK